MKKIKHVLYISLLVWLLDFFLGWQSQVYASDVVLTQAEVQMLRQEFQLQLEQCNKLEETNKKLREELIQLRLELRTLKEKSLNQETQLQISEKALDVANQSLMQQMKEERAVRNKYKKQRNVYGGIVIGGIGYLSVDYLFKKLNKKL